MEQAQILFPDLPASDGPSRVVQFEPRPARRSGTGPGFRLNGEGLADRLRHDVQRQIAHRRRMLAHLEGQSQAYAAGAAQAGPRRE